MTSESKNPLMDHADRFHQYAATGDTLSLEKFLKVTSEINVSNEKGWTALMFAARNGHKNIVKLLMENGCDVSIINSSGQTALDIAKFWGHDQIVSMLSGIDVDASDNQRRMPNQGMVHFFSHNMLDRSAHRRKDNKWLDNAMRVETSVFVLFTNQNPYVVQQADYSEGRQANAYSLLQVRSSDISAYLDSKPLVIFLGEEALPDGESRRAWFAVDSGGLSEDDVKKIQPHAQLLTDRYSLMQLNNTAAAVLSQARPVLAWHDRYAFCSTCGSKSEPDEGGYKRTCCDKECRSNKGIHNTCYPRVDPTAIMAVVSADGKSLLLGRGARHPKGMWSCLAGFMEPGESLEQACRREVFEEAGVTVGRVDYHSCQSWPMPTSLMIGCIAYATTDKIKIDKDELESAQWFSRQEVVQLLTRQHPQGFYCPPPMAIAHHLIKTWVNMTSNL